ncbi:MAG TPA: helix-turn-helix transcriptional regulator [Ktedonobacteraceae bacterium]|nr:helix-turn-helix transcriptional regulator [Ktedonobacteraceae bacterium]
MPSSPSFPENLRMYRRNHGLTQTALARRLNFSPETISAWERGIRRPPVQQIPHLARMMGIEAEKLLQSIDVELDEERESRPEQRAMVSQQRSPVTQFASQTKCEEQIKEAASVTRRAKVLTIRGEKYFMGSRSLLYNLCLPRRSEPVSVRVLVLSPEAAHISEELASRLEHESAEEIRDKMRHSLDNLKYHARRNKDFEVRCYQESPNFKILLFDSTLFVSSFVDGGPKHDLGTEVLMMREGHPLFVGFERYFDDLWERSSLPE